jgi:nitrite reductase/ring-hydroxylating ferredoxin subunit
LRTNLSELVDLPNLDASVYTDPEIFDVEMERIFERAWVYVGHDSEFQEPGEFKTESIGRHPVILVRADDGTVRCFFNRCRHRAASVCQEDCGTARRFQCIYHGWTYNLAGELVAITDRDGYAEDVQPESLGLVEVPRLDSCHGFLFASLSPDGPSLSEYLGGIAERLAEFTALAPAGSIRVFGGTHKTAYNANWKLAMENGVDSYHPAYLHRAVLPADFKNVYHAASEAGYVENVNGHGVLDMRGCPSIVTGGPPESEVYLSIFPNLVIVRAQIRTIRPIAADRTEIYTKAVWLDGLDEAENMRRIRIHEFGFGPAGVIATDDYEAFLRVQAGSFASSVGPMIVSRGLARETTSDTTKRAQLTDETPIRAVYESWMRWMADGR